MNPRTAQKKTSRKRAAKTAELDPEQREALNRLAAVDSLLSPFWSWRSALLPADGKRN